MTTTATRPRIDTLSPGTVVMLEFDGQVQAAVFLGMRWEGSERLAEFQSCDCTDPTCTDHGLDWHSSGTASYTWEAYRYKGHWAYGTSAQRLRLVEVLTTPLG